MTSPSVEPALTEDIIQDVAQQARTLERSYRAQKWAYVPLGLVMVPSLIVCLTRHQGASGTLLLWMMFLMVPPFLAIAWMLTVQGRATEDCGKLSDIFRDEHSDARRSLTSADIGPLLDITVAICGNSLEVPTAMLGDALKAVRAEDEVNLTENQRNFLHELLIAKFLDFNVRNGPPMLEKDRGKVRPAVIAALALLGNRTSIPILERFARKTNDLALRQSARQSVEQIRESLKYGPDQMLRASRAPERPDTLLRAASGDKAQRDGKQLLRADQPESGLQDTSALQQPGEQETPDPNVVVCGIEVK